MEGKTFSRDNKRVFDILKPFVMEGPSWPFVQPFNRKCNGHTALKFQAEVRSAIATQKAKERAMVTSTAIFAGQGKFNFNQNVCKHQQAHNKLLFLEEPVAETKKVTDLPASICDLKLKTGGCHPNLYG